MQSFSGIALLGAIVVRSEKARAEIDHDAPWGGIDTLKSRNFLFTAEHAEVAEMTSLKNKINILRVLRALRGESNSPEGC